MTPEERAQWFEHNTYWALYTSDRYVWALLGEDELVDQHRHPAGPRARR